MRDLTGHPSELPHHHPPGLPRAGEGHAAAEPRTQPEESWKSDEESYPAATALVDLDQVGLDQAAATAVLARFAALQVILQATAGVITDESLSDDRRMALAYLSDSAAFRAGEREALEAALCQASDSPAPTLARALLTAGAAAEGWGHGAGAWACYRTAYQIALAEVWLAEGAAAARALMALAGGGTRSVLLWRRRAQALERRSQQSL